MSVQVSALEAQIIRILKDWYPITVEELMDELSKRKDSIERALKSLIVKGIIELEPLSDKTYIRLLVPDIVAAIRASRALKVYVCNVATQIGETDRYTCGDHVRVIEEHVGADLFDIILSNQRCEGQLMAGTSCVLAEDDLEVDHAVYRADLVDIDHPWRHDSAKFAQVLMDLYQERTGPLVE